MRIFFSLFFWVFHYFIKISCFIIRNKVGQGKCKQILKVISITKICLKYYQIDCQRPKIMIRATIIFEKIGACSESRKCNPPIMTVCSILQHQNTNSSTNNKVGQNNDQPVAAYGLEIIPNSNTECRLTSCLMQLGSDSYYRADKPVGSTQPNL